MRYNKILKNLRLVPRAVWQQILIELKMSWNLVQVGYTRFQISFFNLENFQYYVGILDTQSLIISGHYLIDV